MVNLQHYIWLVYLIKCKYKEHTVHEINRQLCIYTSLALVPKAVSYLSISRILRIFLLCSGSRFGEVGENVSLKTQLSPAQWRHLGLNCLKILNNAIYAASHRTWRAMSNVLAVCIPPSWAASCWPRLLSQGLLLQAQEKNTHLFLLHQTYALFLKHSIAKHCHIHTEMRELKGKWSICHHLLPSSSINVGVTLKEYQSSTAIHEVCYQNTLKMTITWLLIKHG